MINRYRRAARTWAELGLGPFAPLDEAIPELGGLPHGLPHEDAAPAGRMLANTAEREGFAAEEPPAAGPSRSNARSLRRAPSASSALAEREGFEPSVPLRVHMISNHAPSTTRSSLPGTRNGRRFGCPFDGRFIAALARA